MNQLHGKLLGFLYSSNNFSGAGKFHPRSPATCHHKANHNDTKISSDESLVSSLVAPITSPVIPPKLLVDKPIKNNVTCQLTHQKVSILVVPPITTSGIIVIILATASFLLSFIICMNGELDPTAAELPMLAISTIENFAKISLSKIAWNNS